MGTETEAQSEDRRREEVIVALGSNIPPREEYLAAALRFLAEMPDSSVIACSPIEETEGVDVPGEFKDMKFLNRIVIMESSLSPLDFSRRMHAIEDRLGRVRTVRNGPRTIDIDLIRFGDVRMDTEELTLPHPRAKERDFVMRPILSLGRTLDLGGKI